MFSGTSVFEVSVTYGVSLLLPPLPLLLLIIAVIIIKISNIIFC